MIPQMHFFSARSSKRTWKHSMKRCGGDEMAYLLYDLNDETYCLSSTDAVYEDNYYMILRNLLPSHH